MSKYLINVVETYRVDTEPEVETLIAEAKQDKMFALAKYNREYKEKTKKGEVIDAYFKVTLTKAFNLEKEPDRFVSVNYGVDYNG